MHSTQSILLILSQVAKMCVCVFSFFVFFCFFGKSYLDYCAACHEIEYIKYTWKMLSNYDQLYFISYQYAYTM